MKILSHVAGTMMGAAIDAAAKAEQAAEDRKAILQHCAEALAAAADISIEDAERRIQDALRTAAGDMWESGEALDYIQEVLSVGLESLEMIPQEAS